MWLSSWLQKRTSSTPAVNRRPRPTFRPRLEGLEDRWLPSTVTVTNNLDGAYPGSLRYEINYDAQSGDTIVFDSSLSGQTIALNGADLVLNKNLTIQGPGAGQLTISGGSNSRIFEVDGASTTVAISGLTLSGGDARAFEPSEFVEWGGSGSNSSATPVDGQGGAIFNGGTLTVSGCTVSSNSADLTNNINLPADAGGGIYNAGTLTISNSNLANNSVGDAYLANVGNGGGVYNAGTLTISGSALSLNDAYGHGSYAGGGLGGGIENAGTLTVSNCTLSGNWAIDGGGIYNGNRSIANITGCTLTSNGALYAGGGIWNAGSMTLSSSTVSSNTAGSAGAGGGIYNAKAGRLTIQSASTVLNNSAPVGADLDALGSVKISKDSTVGVIGN
jgi:hypothetical protein